MRLTRQFWLGMPVGKTAVVVMAEGQRGQVRYGSELWSAVSSTALQVGIPVVIQGVAGLPLRVSPSLEGVP